MPARTNSVAPSAIRERLRALAAKDGRPLGEIASAARMSPSQLSNTLTGVKENPSVATVARILAAMGKRWRDLD